MTNATYCLALVLKCEEKDLETLKGIEHSLMVAAITDELRDLPIRDLSLDVLLRAVYDIALGRIELARANRIMDLSEKETHKTLSKQEKAELRVLKELDTTEDFVFNKNNVICIHNINAYDKYLYDALEGFAKDTGVAIIAKEEHI